MDTISVTPSAPQINRHVSGNSALSVATALDAHSVADCLLSLVLSIDHTVPIDDALAICTLFAPDDPYRPIREACDRGWVAAEFTDPAYGSTLREIVLRRL